MAVSVREAISRAIVAAEVEWSDDDGGRAAAFERELEARGFAVVPLTPDDGMQYAMVQSATSRPRKEPLHVTVRAAFIAGMSARPRVGKEG